MNKTTILIAEDEAIVAADLAGKLTMLGYEVVQTVASGEEAVAATLRLRPNLVLMDIWLKGSMDGVEATQAIRCEFDTPVIYLTAHSDAATLARAKVTGPFGYVLKPFDERELATTIEMALYKHQSDRQLREQHMLLQTQSEKLQLVNEELAAANEELQAQSEELQLANEELATANEELRIQGEELAASYQELKRSEEIKGRLAAIVDNAEDAIIGKDLNGIIQSWNVGAENVFGYAAEEVLGKNISILNPPGHRDETPDIFARIKLGENIDRFETERIRKDGRIIPVSLTFAPIKDAKGHIIGVSKTAHDITERKRAEEKLRQTTRRFQTIIDQSPIAIYVKNREGRFVLGNRKLEQYTGLPIESLLGRTDYDFAPKEDADRWRKNDLKILEGERAEFEETGIDRDGRPYVNISVKFPLLDDSGTPVEVCGISTEITERKRAEEALQAANEELTATNEELQAQGEELTASYEELNRADLALKGRERLFSEIVRKSPSFVCILRGPEHVFEMANEKYMQLIGERDILGKRLLDALPEVADTPYPGILDRVYQTGEPFSAHDAALMLSREPGGKPEEVWLNFIYLPLREADGTITGIFVHGIDITKRKRAEDSLRRANDELEAKVAERTRELREKDQMLIAQSRQAAMGEMLGNIAHQWRQPLNAVGLIMQSLTLMHDSGKLDRDSLVSMENQIMDLVRHMSQTIDDFRNYFRPDKEKADFHVCQAVEKTVSLVEASFRDNFIATEIRAEASPVISGYRNEYSQVLLNILQNARDAFEQRKVSNPRVTITVGSNNGRSVVSIADNAGGIPGDIIHKVFDPYFSTKGPEHGTGVGLFMSKMIIEKNMGGRLSVRNTTDGAEFRIEV